MSINDILKHHGWELVQRGEWIAVQDHRAEFYEAFKTKRLGKIVDTSFYVTLTQLPEITQELIRQLGREPEPLKSKAKERNVTYWGFDTKDVSEENLTTFVKRLADAVNDIITK